MLHLKLIDNLPSEKEMPQMIGPDLHFESIFCSRLEWTHHDTGVQYQEVQTGLGFKEGLNNFMLVLCF